MDAKKIFDVSGKVIIITGATGNLGTQYVEGLSQVGANVVIADVNLKNCTALAKSVKNRQAYPNGAVTCPLLYP